MDANMKKEIINFCGLPQELTDYKKAKIVILPVPYDGTSTWLKGADKGPEAIISASTHMELYDIETRSCVAEQGIHTLPALATAASPEMMVTTIEKTADKLVQDNKFTVMLGGEHSISIGLIRAYQKKFTKLGVLHLDAHGDTRESYEGSPYNHACVMARAREICPLVQVGIRSTDEEEMTKINIQKVFFAHDIRHDDHWMQKAVNFLPEDVFISIDLDVFDPSVLPSTGTPEPGGMTWYQVLDFLEMVIAQKNVVGFDVVELCPRAEEKSSDFLAAKLIYRLLSMKFGMKNK